MNIAARFHAAPLAVSLLLVGGLAAGRFGAAANPAPIAEELPPATDWSPRSVKIGALVVVGSPAYEAVTTAIHERGWALWPCTGAGRRVTIYAHFSDGFLTRLDGDDACTIRELENLMIPVDGDLDVMIPIDYVK